MTPHNPIPGVRRQAETGCKSRFFACFLTDSRKSLDVLHFGHSHMHRVFVGYPMDAAGLKKWRKTLRLTQSQAAEKLDVGRTTFQNWEHGCVPIPQATQLACEAMTKQSKQRPEFGPVTLVYADRPILPGPECRHETRVLQCEFHDNNESAFARARLVAAASTLHNPTILDVHGEVVWGTPELLRECRSETLLSPVKDDTDTSPATAPASKLHTWREVLYGNKGASGRQVKAARALLGWSQAELARAAGVSLATIGHVEAALVQSKKANKLRRAIELAGIEFIEQNGGGEGVRLREPHRAGSVS
jgi:DNA-binding XRE family transcriptional regulator